ncbi:MAG: hypothetical protein F6K55_01025 [Moorea sp. SIO4A3]|nr:hypothetical protein [Moorena sp. SIO4A3]
MGRWGDGVMGSEFLSTVPCSLFPVPCSLFPVSCFLFPVPDSRFPLLYQNSIKQKDYY